MGQGNNGSFTHNGDAAFAFDFIAPTWTPIRAARGGAVAQVTESSDGNSLRRPELRPGGANKIAIVHQDGTGRPLLPHADGRRGRRRGPDRAPRPAARAGSATRATRHQPHVHFEVGAGPGEPTIQIRFQTAVADCVIPQRGDLLLLQQQLDRPPHGRDAGTGRTGRSRVAPVRVVRRARRGPGAPRGIPGRDPGGRPGTVEAHHQEVSDVARPTPSSGASILGLALAAPLFAAGSRRRRDVRLRRRQPDGLDRASAPRMPALGRSGDELVLLGGTRLRGRHRSPTPRRSRSRARRRTRCSASAYSPAPCPASTSSSTSVPTSCRTRCWSG